VTGRQISTCAIFALLISAAGAYAVDYLVLRIRMLHASPSAPFESVTRTRVLAIPQKSGTIDYQIDQLQPVESVTCVHTLFPHYGRQPCWYLKPRVNQPIRVN
jgi:hypothetical protein